MKTRSPCQPSHARLDRPGLPFPPAVIRPRPARSSKRTASRSRRRRFCSRWPRAMRRMRCSSSRPVIDPAVQESGEADGALGGDRAAAARGPQGAARRGCRAGREERAGGRRLASRSSSKRSIPATRRSCARSSRPGPTRRRPTNTACRRSPRRRARASSKCARSCSRQAPMRTPLPADFLCSTDRSTRTISTSSSSCSRPEPSSASTRGAWSRRPRIPRCALCSKRPSSAAWIRSFRPAAFPARSALPAPTGSGSAGLWPSAGRGTAPRDRSSRDGRCGCAAAWRGSASGAGD